jgi:folate-binding protein YgfZ
MAEARIAELSRRGVVAVSGADATVFLGDLITADIKRVAPLAATYGGLLTPQGKILFDFIIMNEGERFLIDLSRERIPDFIKRLGFYRLRAKVEIEDLSEDFVVLAAWGSDAPPIVDGMVVADPRLVTLGFRAAVPTGAESVADYSLVTEAEYDAHRIALGVPEGGIDFAFGDAFPHDADMDQLGGVDFSKGCYVGQEVVSRMEHRGTARRRIVQVSGDRALPPSGTAILAGERPVGTLGSSAGKEGLALVRLDRAREAREAGLPLKAGETAIELKIPAWARFDWAAASGEE